MIVATSTQRKAAGPNGPMISVLVRTGVKSRKAALKQLAKSYPNCSEQHRADIVEKWWEKRKQRKSSTVRKVQGSRSVVKRGRGRPKTIPDSSFVDSVKSAIELKTFLDAKQIAPEVAARIAVLVEASGGPKEIVGVLSAARQLEKALSR